MINKNIHANAVCLKNKGILITGPSGSGKSDLTLRLILNHNAVLISDDRTLVECSNGVLKASCPQNIRGMLEVRGVGICNFNTKPTAKISLIVKLVSSRAKIERLPEIKTTEILGIKIPTIELYAFESSAPEKIIAAACYQKK
ncbi:MAG: HPr kinase/phosphatase C-terminal domain-containing protein [Alphaproteobacteria bacterium]|nr:HPr kinase/phosphatase C-terminal domain-containing protein [Alphaproteobacteria bacterium]